MVKIEKCVLKRDRTGISKLSGTDQKGPASWALIYGIYSVNKPNAGRASFYKQAYVREIQFIQGK